MNFIPKINTVNRGEETDRYRGAKIWEIIPGDLKNAASLAIHSFSFIRINSIRTSRLKNLENLRLLQKYAEAEMSKTKKNLQLSGKFHKCGTKFLHFTLCFHYYVCTSITGS